MSLFISDVEVDGAVCSVHVEEARIVAIGKDLGRPKGALHLDGDHGMLLPGLHDHHVHLLSAAAAARSITVGPPEVRSVDDLQRVLLTAATREDGWIRAIGYHESVAGILDRDVLDQLVSTSPVRIQHRSGAMWFMNTLGLNRSGIEHTAGPELERDELGRPTGRLWRSDHVFAFHEENDLDGLRVLSELGASRGVTGFTDAAPRQTDAGMQFLVSAHRAGILRQRLTVMSPPGLVPSPDDDVDVGPVKVLLDDVELPSLDDLASTVKGAHRVGRPVAIHCVTDLQSALALAAISVAGANGRDRIEHGSILPEEFDNLALACDVTVVTQPHFIWERGDDYLHDVPTEQHGALYRARTLIDAGIRIAAGTDAPFGSGDPWDAIAAATRRTTRSGATIGARERLTPMQAIDLFTGDPRSPGQPRRIEVGAPADLCLLSLDRAAALEDLSSGNVRATIIDGRVVFDS